MSKLWGLFYRPKTDSVTVKLRLSWMRRMGSPIYLRLDDRKRAMSNKRLSEDIVLDMGEDDKIVGIEILDVSRHLSLEKLLPVQYQVTQGVAT